VAVALGGGWHARAGESRTLGLAVLASIVLHAALLLASPAILERKKPSVFPGPITARLVEPPPVAAPVAPPAEEVPKPQVETPKPPTAKAAPEKARKPAPQTKPAPGPASPAAEPAQPVAPPAPAAPAAAPAPGVTARSEPQPPAAPSADEAGTLAKFRLDIISQATRFKRYPRMAMDNNWEGRTDVRIVFGADGKRVSITVVRSSGHETLDRQALDTVSKAFVPVPAALRGKEFSVEIPVIYSLKDENA